MTKEEFDSIPSTKDYLISKGIAADIAEEMEEHILAIAPKMLADAFIHILPATTPIGKINYLEYPSNRR